MDQNRVVSEKTGIIGIFVEEPDMTAETCLDECCFSKEPNSCLSCAFPCRPRERDDKKQGYFKVETV